MIEKVYKTIKKYGLLKKGERVVVALSGGPDSTALLLVLDALARRLDLSLIVAHYNHGLRGTESDEDENFSRELARKMGWTFVSGKMRRKKAPRGISPEDFYRRQRYGFLEKVASDYRAQKIALGHHLQDQAETVLLNLLRGSGLEGLRGFLPNRDGRIIRPFIEISRREIISFLDNAGMTGRRDSSNESSMYLRNRLRAELIPYLKEKYNPKIVENLARMAEILRTENEFIEQHVAKALRSSCIQKHQNSILLEIDFVNKLPEAVRLRLLKTLLESLNPAKNGISSVHVKSLDHLLQKNESGKKIILPLNVEARREYDNLILERRKTGSERVKYEYAVKIPSSCHVRERDMNIHLERVHKKNVDVHDKNKIYLDLDKIRQPLVIRNRRDGDWFQPLGTQGKQKIKKFFIDRKVPVCRRDEIMLVVDDLSVICIENMHLDERVKVTPQTRKILKIEITNP